MRVIVVYIGEIMHCPPALSLVQVLNDLDVDTILCAIGDDKKALRDSLIDLKNVTIEFVGENYKSSISLQKKFLRMHEIRKKLWSVIDRYYNDTTVIWVVSEGSLKHLGKRILGKNYIIHLLELNEGIYYISGNPILKMDYKRLAQNAKIVVEAEYNRAHITKAWWELKELPSIFPNKPYNVIQVNKNAEITSNDYVNGILKKIKDRKIILYQGNISKERPLEEYVRAVGELGEEYAFIMMINGENPYPELKYENFYCLPFIKPPFHLEVTSHAFIGILSYIPIKNDYSILNTLYCAPNKVWEYAKFGIPMIGNDLPALREMFIEYGNGICLPELKKQEIKKAILQIADKYANYSKASEQFFESVDLKKVVQGILDKSTEA